MSKLRTDQLETLDGLNTKSVATLIDDINNAEVTTETGTQALSTALNARATETELSTLRADTLLETDLTVNIPTDYASLQAAIDDLSAVSVKQGVQITLNIETGHQPVSGVLVTDGDYGHFIISSVDAEVTLASSFPSGTDFIACTNGRAPVLDCLVNANGLARYGVNCQQGAYITVNSGCGVKNTTDRGIYLNNSSSALANGSVFTGVGSVVSGSLMRGAWVTRGSTLLAEQADFSNAGGVGVYVSRASTFHAMGVTVENATNEAIWAHRSSRITAHSAVGFSVSLSTNSAFSVVNITRGSTGAVNADAGGTVTITQSGSGDGINASAAIIDCTEATINGGASSGNGINCSDASSVKANNATIDGFNNNILSSSGYVQAAAAALTNARANGAFAQRGELSIASGSVTGSATNDLAISDGAFMRADGCTTSNGVGSPDLADTNVTAFNSLDGRGAMFD